MKTGLVLSGGGVKGSYEVGSYFAFKKCHIKISGVVGTSIGAFNGAMIASHKDKELLNFWLNINVGKILSFNEKYINKVNSKIIDQEYFSLSFQEFFNILKDKGIKIDGLRSELEKYNLEYSLRNSDILYGLSTVRLKDLKPLDLFISDMKEGSVNNYILSSCYLPVFKKEKLEDNSYYYDGGFANYAPCNMLINKKFDKIYCIDLKAIGIKKKVDNTNIIYITPSHKLSNIITLNQDKIKENLKLGYYDTLKVLKNYDGKKYIFKKRSNFYYNHVIKKISINEQNILKAFFKCKDNKSLVINICEFMMKKSNYSYYKIYNINQIIKKFKYNNDKNIVFKIAKKLKPIIF